MLIRVQTEPFDEAVELAAFAAGTPDAGARVSFTGIVRDDGGDLQFMEIEHYPGMTEAALRDIAERAVERFDLIGAAIIHRHGRLEPGETIMMVATAARHRSAAFQGAEFLMDFLKSRAPFWKKEVTGQGEAWVDAKDADESALKRW